MGLQRGFAFVGWVYREIWLGLQGELRLFGRVYRKISPLFWLVLQGDFAFFGWVYRKICSFGLVLQGVRKENIRLAICEVSTTFWLSPKAPMFAIILAGFAAERKPPFSWVQIPGSLNVD